MNERPCLCPACRPSVALAGQQSKDRTEHGPQGLPRSAPACPSRITPVPQTYVHPPVKLDASGLPLPHLVFPLQDFAGAMCEVPFPISSSKPQPPRKASRGKTPPSPDHPALLSPGISMGAASPDRAPSGQGGAESPLGPHRPLQNCLLSPGPRRRWVQGQGCPQDPSTTCFPNSTLLTPSFSQH